MTVTRTPVVLWMEQAPSDRFDDDSPPRFRVVAALGQGAARRHIVPLTREHDSEAEAMSVLSDKILRGHGVFLTAPAPPSSVIQVPDMPEADVDGRKWWRR